MKNLKKSIMPIAALAVAALFYFLPSTASSEISSQFVKPDTMIFSGCWGSGDFNKSCTNGSATVMGCEPQENSFCAGVRDIPELPE